MNIAQWIRKVQAVIDVPEKWCQRDLALDNRGMRVMPRDPSAVRFCLTGATVLVTPNETMRVCVIREMKSLFNGNGVADTNDANNWLTLQLALDFAALSLENEQ